MKMSRDLGMILLACAAGWGMMRWAERNKPKPPPPSFMGMPLKDYYLVGGKWEGGSSKVRVVDTKP